MVQLTSQKSAQFIVHVREDMVPDMFVVATHVTTNGTIMADEVHFKVQGLPFRNKVCAIIRGKADRASQQFLQK